MKNSTNCENMGNGSNIKKKWKIAKYAKLNFIKIITIFGKVILIWKRVKILQNRKMWEMAASYKDKIWQKNHLISKQILNIEVHTCFISKHVSMCWFLNSSRFSVKLQMIFNLFPPPFVEKITPLEVRHALWMAPKDSGKLWTKVWTKLWTVNREPWDEADVPSHRYLDKRCKHIFSLI